METNDTEVTKKDIKDIALEMLDSDNSVGFYIDSDTEKLLD